MTTDSVYIHRADPWHCGGQPTRMRPVTHDLVALAAAYGVATEFWDQAGAHHEVGEATVVAVLAWSQNSVATP